MTTIVLSNSTHKTETFAVINYLQLLRLSYNSVEIVKKKVMIWES